MHAPSTWTYPAVPATAAVAMRLPHGTLPGVLLLLAALAEGIALVLSRRRRRLVAVVGVVRVDDVTARARLGCRWKMIDK